MTLRSLFGSTVLRAMAARTPPPVATYPLPRLEKRVERGPVARAQVNGLELEYQTFGDSGDPPLLLVMGLGGQMVAWHDDFCARLAARGYRVIRFDNRDIGPSTWLDHEPVPNLIHLLRARRRGAALRVPYLLSEMAADALGVLDVLSVSSAHFLGTSMWGRRTAAAVPGAELEVIGRMGHALPPPLWERIIERVVRDAERYEASGEADQPRQRRTFA